MKLHPLVAPCRENYFNWRSVRATLALALAPCAVVQAQSNYATPYSFTTLAGSGGKSGSADGTGSAARFSAPYGMAVDSGGNVYVSDPITHTIRKITSVGVVTTLAGTPGNVGSADGAGAAAQFNSPEGVSVDASGNLYVADTGSHTIRKITPAGVVSTLAGAAGVYGSEEGPGSAARFRFPAGVAVDAAGTVYVCDTLNSTIRKITAAGVVTTLAGLAGSAGTADGTGAAARFGQPGGIAVDNQGNIYAADTNSFTIRKITPAGVVTTFAGSANNPGSVDDTGAAARFTQPRGIAVDSAGDLYVATTGTHTIRKVTAAAVVTTLAGSNGLSGSSDGTGATARFFQPRGAAVDAAGNVYIGDTFNQTVRKITPAGVVTTLAGLAGNTTSADGAGPAAGFRNPTAVGVDNAGNLYVSDTNQIIRKVTPSGQVTTLAGLAGVAGANDGTGAAARFINPEGVATDLAGNIYVASGSMIRKITPAGVVTTLAGSPVQGAADGSGAAAQFSVPRGLAADSVGNLYVGDTNSATVRKITPAGVVTTLAGTAGSVGSVDGTGSAARFNQPRGVAVDGAGNVYVADTGNHTIRRITPLGGVTTLAGAAGSAGSADGTGTAARFDQPRGVATDGAGNVYVADTSNQTIRKITLAGVVTTLAGTADVAGNIDDTGGAARFNQPNSVAVDSAGNVYVVDLANNTLRKGSLAPASPGPVSAISNVSVRTTLATSQTLIVGFTMQGGTKSVLVRAVGPGLAQFSVTGTMADPRLALFKEGTQLDANDNWGGGSALSTAFASVGAFGLPTASLDAALLRSIEGGHTAQITGPAGTVLVEAYDAGTGLSSRLTNISARNRAGTGGDILIAGFTISGTGPKNLLIRAVGPTLASFGVTGTLTDPKLELYSGSTKIAENDTWSATLADTFGSVGAFALTAGSRDAALTITLPPGGYTVQVSGSDGGTGEALIELYELP